MKFAVVTFPGSNSDHDSYSAVKILGEPVDYVWHQDSDLSGYDCVILPGGFSYGDYLRSGAIARFSPIMEAVRKFADAGGIVAGFCNGFQVLVESGMLPGALIRNSSLRFLGRWVYLKVENNQTVFTRNYELHEVIKVPIAHGEGNYYNYSDDLARAEKNGQVVFRYCDKFGNVDEEPGAAESPNVNGSLNSIAGIVNERGNVLGMMPHPERATELIIGSTDGLKLFESIRESIIESPAGALA